MNPTILNSSFQHPTDGWYQVEALGEHPHRTANLVQVIDAEAAEAIVKRFNTDAAAGALRHGHELLIDHEHFSEQPDQETRAYGWLAELQHRADGIYGRIRWTKTGKEAVDGGDYRFFSTEYEPADLVAVGETNAKGGQVRHVRHVRPVRLAGLTLTNMNNNRGQRPITNREGAPSTASARSQKHHRAETVLGAPIQTTFADGQAGVRPGASAHTDTTSTQNKGTTMKSVCTLLGLSAEAEETAVHAAVSRLLNRGDITTDALAALRAEHQSLAEQNQTLLGEQAEALLDGCGVKDERLRNRLADGLKLLKNRQERLGYLADFGYEPGKASAEGSRPTARVLNRGTGAARELPASFANENEQAVAVKIQNRAGELQGKGLKYDAAWNQARREILRP